jgi:hypothetical protein
MKKSIVNLKTRYSIKQHQDVFSDKFQCGGSNNLTKVAARASENSAEQDLNGIFIV